MIICYYTMFGILQSILLVILMADYMERHNNIVVNGALYVIRFYSMLEIMCLRIYRENPIIQDTIQKWREKYEPLLNLHKKKEEVYVYVKNRQIGNEEDYDFKIKREGACRKIYYKSEAETEELEECSIRFFLIEYCRGKEKYDIVLEDKKYPYHYYVVGNILTRDFFEHYVRVHYHAPPEMPEGCTVVVIDHNVNRIELDYSVDPNQSIALTKDGYNIVNKTI